MTGRRSVRAQPVGPVQSEPFGGGSDCCVWALETRMYVELDGSSCDAQAPLIFDGPAGIYPSVSADSSPFTLPAGLWHFTGQLLVELYEPAVSSGGAWAWYNSGGPWPASDVTRGGGLDASADFEVGDTVAAGVLYGVVLQDAPWTPQFQVRLNGGGLGTVGLWATAYGSPCPCSHDSTTGAT